MPAGTRQKIYLAPTQNVLAARIRAGAHAREGDGRAPPERGSARASPDLIRIYTNRFDSDAALAEDIKMRMKPRHPDDLDKLE